MIKFKSPYRFLVHGSNDGDETILPIVEGFSNLISKVTFRELDIVLQASIGKHEFEEVILLDVVLQKQVHHVFYIVQRLSLTYDRVFGTADVGYIHVVGGWGDIFLLTNSISDI